MSTHKTRMRWPDGPDHPGLSRVSPSCPSVWCLGFGPALPTPAGSCPVEGQNVLTFSWRMGRKEILKAQNAIPCQRPRKPTPEGLRQEPWGQRELEACRPKNCGGKSVSLVGLRGRLAVGRDWEVGLGWPLLGQKNGRQMAKQKVPRQGEECEHFSPSWPHLSAYAFCPTFLNSFHLWPCHSIPGSVLLPAILLAPPPLLTSCTASLPKLVMSHPSPTPSLCLISVHYWHDESRRMVESHRDKRFPCLQIPAMTESHPQQLLSCLSRTHQMQDTQQVSLTLQLQKLEQGPKKPKKQHESKCFQSNPEKILCWVTTSFANRYCEKRPSLPHWILPFLDAILETLKILYSYLSSGYSCFSCGNSG